MIGGDIGDQLLVCTIHKSANDAEGAPTLDENSIDPSNLMPPSLSPFLRITTQILLVWIKSELVLLQTTQRFRYEP